MNVDNHVDGSNHEPSLSSALILLANSFQQRTNLCAFAFMRSSKVSKINIWIEIHFIKIIGIIEFNINLCTLLMYIIFLSISFVPNNFFR